MQTEHDRDCEATAVADWCEAFDVCRERDRPLVVMDTDGSKSRIYPSGSERPADGHRADLAIVPED